MAVHGGGTALRVSPKTEGAAASGKVGARAGGALLETAASTKPPPAGTVGVKRPLTALGSPAESHPQQRQQPGGRGDARPRPAATAEPPRGSGGGVNSGSGMKPRDVQIAPSHISKVGPGHAAGQSFTSKAPSSGGGGKAAGISAAGTSGVGTSGTPAAVVGPPSVPSAAASSGEAAKKAKHVGPPGIGERCRCAGWLTIIRRSWLAFHLRTLLRMLALNPRVISIGHAVQGSWACYF